ncbi:MAG TPA: helix-turn-helix transcriptional regulator [Gammaproteobacteria bacterium]|nr:helix-turn-helix transcriptional regulator [Gammaproteobacteria bacterium]
MSIQIIKKGNKAEYAVVPFADYERLVMQAEEAAEIAAYDIVKRNIALGGEEFFPLEFVERLWEADHPLRPWREYRGFTLASLAKECDVSASALSQIEKGSRHASAKLLQKLAEALRCDMDDLMPNTEEPAH